MSDTVTALVQIDELKVHEGSEWPADHPVVLANPSWFSGYSAPTALEVVTAGPNDTPDPTLPAPVVEAAPVVTMPEVVAAPETETTIESGTDH